MMYYQCTLQREDVTTVGWIEARGAKKSNLVELIELGGFWKVIDVTFPGMDATDLRDKQSRDRGCLPSLQSA